jgi:hypothetical protein
MFSSAAHPLPDGKSSETPCALCRLGHGGVCPTKEDPVAGLGASSELFVFHAECKLEHVKNQNLRLYHLHKVQE